jgi:hypothetical protein
MVSPGSLLTGSQFRCAPEWVDSLIFSKSRFTGSGQIRSLSSRLVTYRGASQCDPKRASQKSEAHGAVRKLLAKANDEQGSAALLPGITYRSHSADFANANEQTKDDGHC